MKSSRSAAIDGLRVSLWRGPVLRGGLMDAFSRLSKTAKVYWGALAFALVAVVLLLVDYTGSSLPLHVVSWASVGAVVVFATARWASEQGWWASQHIRAIWLVATASTIALMSVGPSDRGTVWAVVSWLGFGGTIVWTALVLRRMLDEQTLSRVAKVFFIATYYLFAVAIGSLVLPLVVPESSSVTRGFVAFIAESKPFLLGVSKYTRYLGAASLFGAVLASTDWRFVTKPRVPEYRLAVPVVDFPLLRAIVEAVYAVVNQVILRAVAACEWTARCVARYLFVSCCRFLVTLAEVIGSYLRTFCLGFQLLFVPVLFLAASSVVLVYSNDFLVAQLGPLAWYDVWRPFVWAAGCLAVGLLVDAAAVTICLNRASLGKVAENVILVVVAVGLALILAIPLAAALPGTRTGVGLPWVLLLLGFLTPLAIQIARAARRKTTTTGDPPPEMASPDAPSRRGAHVAPPPPQP